MLIAPTRSQHQSLQEEKENPIEAEPVLLQEQAATADASATDVPAEETTAISSEGAVETNIGTKTKQNIIRKI